MSSYSLRQFIHDAEAVVRSYSTEPAILRGIKPHLERLLNNPNLPPEAFMPKKDMSYPAMNLVYMPKDKVFSIIGAVWHPGQTSPIHDHMTWALVGVYNGAEKEMLYRKTDDGSNPKIAKLEKVAERVNKAGQVVTLGETAIHRVDNNFEDQATSGLHIYGLDVGGRERHMYDPATGEVKNFTSGYCNVLPDPDRY